jgi:hypothetical protein
MPPGQALSARVIRDLSLLHLVSQLGASEQRCLNGGAVSQIKHQGASIGRL